jgi:hypothetical protein
MKVTNVYEIYFLSCISLYDEPFLKNVQSSLLLYTDQNEVSNEDLCSNLNISLFGSFENE